MHVRNRQLISSRQTLKILLHPIYHTDVYLFKKGRKSTQNKTNHKNHVQKHTFSWTETPISICHPRAETSGTDLHVLHTSYLLQIPLCKVGKTEPNVHDVEVLLTQLGPSYSSSITAQLSGPLVFRLFICPFPMILGAAYLQEQIHLQEIHHSELPRSADTQASISNG